MALRSTAALRHDARAIYNISTRGLERRRAASDEGRPRLGDAVGERELEAGGQELLDVGPANIVGLFNLSDTEDLQQVHRLHRVAHQGVLVQEQEGLCGQRLL